MNRLKRFNGEKLCDFPCIRNKLRVVWCNYSDGSAFARSNKINPAKIIYRMVDFYIANYNANIE